MGGKTYSYQYDADGIRTRKTNFDGGYTEYYVVEGLPVAEQRFTATGAKLYILQYLYDESNNAVGFGIYYPTDTSPNWQYYYFGKNIQGDVIALYRSDYNSSNGTYSPTLVATYSYDPWGTPTGIYDANGNSISQTADHVAAYNPFRYRGYRYDGDTRLYYLQSRYYDPVVGRFINADVYASTGQGFIGHNMFAYCGNNPIRYIDFAGEYYQPWTDKYVHDQVLKDIAASNSDLHMRFTCIKYLDENGQPTGKYGFCDLYHGKTGEVWELKKDSTSPSCLTENASKQLDRYISGRLRADPGLELRRPYTTTVVTGVKHITRYRGNWIYEIDYWYEGNGILRYSYEKRYNIERAYAEALALALVATIAVAPYAAVGCAGAGALAALF